MVNGYLSFLKNNSLIVIIVLLIMFLLIAFNVVINWIMFEKAGEKGWKALIPIYSNIVALDIVGFKWYYVLIYFLGFFSVGSVIVIVFELIFGIKLAKSFGQTTAFGFGIALLSPVFIAMIAFDKNINYIGKTVNGDIDLNDLF